jgi:hypothetical protein
VFAEIGLLVLAVASSKEWGMIERGSKNLGRMGRGQESVVGRVGRFGSLNFSILCVGSNRVGYVDQPCRHELS